MHWALEDLRPYLLTLTLPIRGLTLAADLEVIDGNLNALICADGRDEVLGSARTPPVDELSAVDRSIAV